MTNIPLDRTRAAHALKMVEAIKGKKFASSYRSYVERLGPMIISNGLGMAIAMETSYKGGSDNNSNEEVGHGELLKTLKEWLDERKICNKSKDDIIVQLVTWDQDKYILAQMEVLSYLEWLKKFCRAYIKR